MLTRCVTAFTAFLAAVGQSAVMVAPPCRVKGQPEAELTLSCGDGKRAGVVQFWFTPFGELRTPGFHGDQDPVFLLHDGSLRVANSSALHSGVYYCVLQHADGASLWPYELHVSRENQRRRRHEAPCSRGAFRARRDAGREGAGGHAGVSDAEFAGAVTASVLLAFVLGFSSGALSRSHVLRCLRAINVRLRSPRQRRCHAGRVDSVAVTTVPPMYENHAFETEPAGADDPATSVTAETRIFPPAKPQRSFRMKEPQEQENTAYLEGCDYKREEEEEEEKEEEEEEEEGGAGRSLEDKSEGCDDEEEEEEEEKDEEEDGELSGFYPLGEDGGSETETEEDECSEDGGERREEKGERRQEEEVEEQKSRRGEEGRGSEEENGGLEKREEEREDDGEVSMETEDAETGHKKQEDTVTAGGRGGGGGGAVSRRSRVIRLYQYDEDGRRYEHLPGSAPDHTSPAPRLRQRSLSLTRLNAIMAAASAGPLDTKDDTGRGERPPHFHMEI